MFLFFFGCAGPCIASSFRPERSGLPALMSFMPAAGIRLTDDAGTATAEFRLFRGGLGVLANRDIKPDCVFGAGVIFDTGANGFGAGVILAAGTGGFGAGGGGIRKAGFDTAGAGLGAGGETGTGLAATIRAGCVWDAGVPDGLPDPFCKI